MSGELEIIGGDGSVDIRDSNGKLKVTNADGRVRVIGFDGEVNAQTDDGDVYLEGTFARLNARAASGSFTVTLPADVNADLSSTRSPSQRDSRLPNAVRRSWRLGSGGTNFSFSSQDGRVVLRNSSVLSK